MKFRLCGRCFWPKRNMPQTSGGSLVWVPSATSNRTCPKAGRRCRPPARECSLIACLHSNQMEHNTSWCLSRPPRTLHASETPPPTPAPAEPLAHMVVVWHGYITTSCTLMTVVVPLLSRGNDPLTCSFLVSDISPPPPLWMTSAAPARECRSSRWHHILYESHLYCKSCCRCPPPPVCPGLIY